MVDPTGEKTRLRNGNPKPRVVSTRRLGIDLRSTRSSFIPTRFQPLVMSDQPPAAVPVASNSNDSNAQAGPSTERPSSPLLAPGDPAKEEALKAFKKALKKHEESSENLKKSE